ncbi:MAG: hypothetical protein E6G48_04010 [Actinobacteria bacterium]|nr:MAG: hypothetical protein E6G48_04010 [Actinomycetota bacterium]
MSPAVPIALAVLLGAAALWELAGSRGEELDRSMRGAVATLSGGHVRTLAGAALWLRVPQRLRRAGLAERIPVWLRVPQRLRRAGLAERIPVAAVLAGKAGGVVVGALLAVVVAPELSARLAIVLALALPAAGRSPATVFGEISTGSSGPLASELAVAVAEIHCGVPQREAIAAVRERVPGTGLGALASALERSRRHGSPLAEQLHEQAAELRREARRRIEERAARAAPKIQLVVALVLVPSVLLMLLAALVAHSDALLGAV